MTASGSPGVAPAIPGSIWVVGWASVAGQLVLLAQRGIRSDDEAALLFSVVFGGLLVGYVSAGVIRARPVRLVVAWVVLVLSLIGGIVALASVDGTGKGALGVLSIATTIAALAGLASFRRSDWYAWQRQRPPAHEGPSIGPLVAIAVLVGVMGGLVAPFDDGLHMRVTVGDRGSPAGLGDSAR